jgi:uncharacterized membrane protein YcaP (DUF421 family)
MTAFDAVDWNAVFVPRVGLLEIFLRGTMIYLSLFALLRFVLKRQSGTLGVTDLLVVVLIADAAQNAMASDYKSVPEGVLLVGTIIFWSYLLDYLGSRFPAVGRFVHPPPLLLVKDGRMLRRNMREELITPEELQSLLREEGVKDIKHVKRAYMEGDGRISVLQAEGAKKPRGGRRKSAN